MRNQVGETQGHQFDFDYFPFIPFSILKGYFQPVLAVFVVLQILAYGRPLRPADQNKRMFQNEIGQLKTLNSEPLREKSFQE